MRLISYSSDGRQQKIRSCRQCTRKSFPPSAEQVNQEVKQGRWTLCLPVSASCWLQIADGSLLKVVLLKMSNGTTRAGGIEEWQQRAERPSVTHEALLLSIFAPCLPCRVKTQHTHTKKTAQARQRFSLWCRDPLKKHDVLRCAALKICLCNPNWAQILLVLGQKWQFKEHFLFLW